VADRAFIRKVFSPYASLRRRQPEKGLNEWKPYRGEPFDENIWKIVPDGWDHEHCSLLLVQDHRWDDVLD
jgi:hypothetical protein